MYFGFFCRSLRFGLVCCWELLRAVDGSSGGKHTSTPFLKSGRMQAGVVCLSRDALLLPSRRFVLFSHEASVGRYVSCPSFGLTKSICFGQTLLLQFSSGHTCSLGWAQNNTCGMHGTRVLPSTRVGLTTLDREQKVILWEGS